ncbi:MAG TPA: glutathione binding-like protein [Kofleriaceae bacterium]
MIDAYVWTTPNGYKALIALEELELPYTTHWVDIRSGAQHKPEYLAINPNNKIPAVVDPAGPDGKSIKVFESGAVLAYLGDKAGRLMPASGADRYAVLEWLFFGAGGIGPMGGQLGYWNLFASEKNPPAVERYLTETKRIVGVIDRRLDESKFLAGSEYSVADIMNFTWARAVSHFGVDMQQYANVRRWLDTIEARPAVARALAMNPPGVEPMKLPPSSR